MHVLLTGASSGIGESLARAMARDSANITLVARRKDELERVARSIGDRAKVQVLPCDLSQLDELEGLVKRAEDGVGPVEVLVNNAGLERVARTTDVPIAEGEKLLRVNLLAPLRLIQMLIPGMAKAGMGRIVNVTSVAGLTPMPYATHYSASKAALSSASEHLRHELAPLGIRVLTVYPGPIVTPMGERAAASYEVDALPRMFWGSADGLANAVVRSLDRGCARLIYPRAYSVVKWFPGLSRWVMFRFAPPPHKA